MTPCQYIILYIFLLTETEGQDKEHNRIIQQPFFPTSLTASVIDLIASLENAVTDCNGVSGNLPPCGLNICAI